ncbi:hypothetical protein CROQUDRAFT_671597 [Cronartium quercuum f. sp. fusiforme G11]|uniref:Glycosyltransferase family 31 protein n=1 Tax=Cronartium quercuum f. sp. fusiforme G11 TaxID=708437 RepID=A0A9P6NGN5_9BASI|nr:hypothetical protein CROQUDRAFT_671597 [Cronartium quercuum f. sp. fusiforme G11]
MGRVSRRPCIFLFLSGLIGAFRLYMFMKVQKSRTDETLYDRVDKKLDDPKDSPLFGKLRPLILAQKTVGGISSSSLLSQPTSRFGPSFFSFSSTREFCPTKNDNRASTIILRPSGILKNSEKRTAQMPTRKDEPLLTPLLNKPKSQIPMGFFTRLLSLVFSSEAFPSCSVYDIETSSFPADFGLDSNEGVAQDFHRPVFMFGLSSSAARLSEVLPLWKDWMGRDGETAEPGTPTSALILAPADDPPEQIQQTRSHIAKSSLNVDLEFVHTSRYQRRYFALVRWLWYTTKERTGAEEVDWYVLCDDDTYFLDIASARHGIPAVLDQYQSPKSVPYLVGSLSESSDQLRERGVIAYGGAGIFVSRELMRMMNLPGQWEACDEEFAELLGGDMMISWCATRAMKAISPSQIISLEPSLHQIDVKGAAHGIFQAGWEFASLHHFRSWFYFFPSTHTYGPHDENEIVSLIGFIARAIGASNWGRRFVWSLDNNDKPGEELLVICLGFSITKYDRGVIEMKDLDRVEETFESVNLTVPTRPRIIEGQGKRTFLIAEAQFLPSEISKGGLSKYYDVHRNPEIPVREVLRMRYIDSEGESLEIIWDPRSHENRLWSSVKP